MTLQLTAEKGRGQLPLTAEAIEVICREYGWRASTATGYIDRGDVFIGSEYAGYVDCADRLVLDRGTTRQQAKRLPVMPL